MFTSTFKTVAVTSVALAGLLALGACTKKEETTTTTVIPAPVTTPATGSTSSGSAMPPSSNAPMSSGMTSPTPMPAASGSTN